MNPFQVTTLLVSRPNRLTLLKLQISTTQVRRRDLFLIFLRYGRMAD